MKRVILALTASALIATGTLFASANSAIAAYNLTGQWNFTFDNLPGPCPGSLSQTYGDAATDDITVVWQCPGDANPHSLNGAIDKTTGSFVFGDYMTDLFQITGMASGDNLSVSGHWTGFPSSFNGAFSGTGGNGDPKLSSPTSTATATPTPRPVGGVALASRNGGTAFGAWWLAAIAGAAFVVLGGAALYTRKRT